MVSKKSGDAKRILIIDDEEDITNPLKIGLMQHGFRVDAYNDPEEALSNYARDLYDIIIVDIRMPGLNGFELVKKIRANEETKARIWFLTAFEIYREEFEKLFPELPIQRFVSKPIMAADLAKLIDEELEEVLVRVPRNDGT
jgi:two-component system, OmpR family, response regulator ChvI